MVKPNRGYKNSLFKDLFHDEAAALELYNALTDGNFTRRDVLRFTTLENALFMDRLNDISFTIGDRLVVLVDHQSTVNSDISYGFYCGDAIRHVYCVDLARSTRHIVS